MGIKLAARAIIVDKGELLVVKHLHSNFYALPGGKREHGESLQVALAREIEEEFGLGSAKIGELCCVNEFEYNHDVDRYSLELFFWIQNPEVFRSIKQGAYVEEIEEIRWISNFSDIFLQPEAAVPMLTQALSGEPPREIAYFTQMDHNRDINP